MTTEAELRESIERFLTDRCSFEDFERQYYTLWIEGSPSVSDVTYEFFSKAQERLDWTDEAPTDQERRDGWWDQGEYKSWLRQAYSELQARGRP